MSDTATKNKLTEKDIMIQKEFVSWVNQVVTELNNNIDYLVDESLIGKFDYRPFRLEKSSNLYIFTISFLNLNGDKKNVASIIFEVERLGVDIVVLRKGGAQVNFVALVKFLKARHSTLELKARIATNNDNKNRIVINTTYDN